MNKFIHKLHIWYGRILKIIRNGGLQNVMTVEYLEDGSSLLVLVSSIQEGAIGHYLQSKREMIRHTFAFFNHKNYAYTFLINFFFQKM